MEHNKRNSAVLMIGETLLILQKFEQCLIAALLDTISESEADKRLEKILLRDKETLGRLINYLSERTELPDHFAETFDSLLEMRNVFVHKLFVQPWFDIKSQEGCLTLQAFMKDIRSKLKIALHVIIASLLFRPTASSTQEAQGRYVHILSCIESTAEPDFGELNEDEYIAKVRENATKLYMQYFSEPKV